MDSRGYSIIEYLEDWDLPTMSGEKINSEREKKKKKKREEEEEEDELTTVGTKNTNHKWCKNKNLDTNKKSPTKKKRVRLQREVDM
jgi:hypothetical protein